MLGDKDREARGLDERRYFEEFGDGTVELLLGRGQTVGKQRGIQAGKDGRARRGVERSDILDENQSAGGASRERMAKGYWSRARKRRCDGLGDRRWSRVGIIRVASPEPMGKPVSANTKTRSKAETAAESSTPSGRTPISQTSQATTESKSLDASLRRVEVRRAAE
jgi:hypothetical protein